MLPEVLAERADRPRPPRRQSTADTLYALGVGGVLVGCVLPWLRLDGQTVWGWDFSVLWSLTGRRDVVAWPPSAAAFALVSVLVLAIPVVAGGRIRPALASALSGAVIGITALTVLRSYAIADRPPVQAGLVVLGAGAVLLTAGSLLQTPVRHQVP